MKLTCYCIMFLFIHIIKYVSCEEYKINKEEENGKHNKEEIKNEKYDNNNYENKNNENNKNIDSNNREDHIMKLLPIYKDKDNDIIDENINNKINYYEKDNIKQEIKHNTENDNNNNNNIFIQEKDNIQLYVDKKEHLDERNQNVIHENMKQEQDRNKETQKGNDIDESKKQKEKEQHTNQLIDNRNDQISNVEKEDIHNGYENDKDTEQKDDNKEDKKDIEQDIEQVDDNKEDKKDTEQVDDNKEDKKDPHQTDDKNDGASCEEEKKVIMSEIKTIKEDLDNCNITNKKDKNECIVKVNESERKLNLCKEKALKCKGQIKGIHHKCDERIDRKNKEMIILQGIINKLENKIDEDKKNDNKNFQDHIKKSEGKKNEIPVENKNTKDNVKRNEKNVHHEDYSSHHNIYRQEDNYLISYEILKNYFEKIFEIYKTLYIIIVEKTFLSIFVNNILYTIDLIIFLTKKCITGTIDIIYICYRFFGHHYIINCMIQIFENSFLYNYYNFFKRKINNIKLILENCFSNLISENKPKVMTLKNNIQKNVDVFVHKLNDSSENLVNHINTINPHVRGIIPPSLSDKIILLIFFTVVNIIHLYILFCLLFILYEFLKRATKFTIKWGSLIIRHIYYFIFFFLTIPVRPCMRKRAGKGRRGYRRHDDFMYNNDRMNNYERVNSFDRKGSYDYNRNGYDEKGSYERNYNYDRTYDRNYDRNYDRTYDRNYDRLYNKIHNNNIYISI
ncbi:hypothetical protein PFUGPA_04600 [Plasmodium falciparum Palo Alto/Uganda]|uniref:Uncharacterized protein n=1 Tax=Plasmodium falciparum (isolate Palo Alto / Uganda) TaxID=57270 RepID=W4IUW6_PLAFP|nr:hypothetical protein PFUGPA_04600 [Plasmodium falciparum Palo Alto/Uganda]